MAISLHSLDEYHPGGQGGSTAASRATVASAARARLAAARRAVARENARWAELNQRDVDAADVHLVNLTSVQGAGKTALITETMFQAAGLLRIGAVQTPFDGRQLENVGAVVSELTAEEVSAQPGYLDAGVVRAALSRLHLPSLDTVFVQNRCTVEEGALDRLGEHDRVMVYATTQGHLQPAKYPELFRSIDLLVLTKIDLIPYLDFDFQCFQENLHRVNPRVSILPVSNRTGDGVEAWLDWLLERRR